MKNFISLIGIGVIGLNFLMVISPALAQEAGGLVKAECSEFVQPFGVSVEVTSDLAEALAGGQMRFYANIINENDSPIVDGELFVKIFEAQTDLASVDKNGHFLVDQFFVKEKLVVKAKGSKKIEFLWTVPAWATQGQYIVNTYVLSAKKFNLGGVVESDATSAGRSYFDVSSEIKKGVRLDKNNVKVDDKVYAFNSQEAVVGKDALPTVKVPLKNFTSEKQEIAVTYKLTPGNLLTNQSIDTKQETVQLSPGETKIISYQVKDKNNDAHVLTVSAKWHDLSSIVNVGLTKEGAQENPELEFLGMKNFPVKAQETVSVFSCLARVANDFQGKLVMTIEDDKGEVVKEVSYTGGTADFSALKGEFVSDKPLDKVVLKASLYDAENKVLDQATLNYDCKELDPESCTKVEGGDGTTPGTGGGVKTIYIVIIGLILLVLIAVVLIIKKRRTPGGDGGSPPPSMPNYPQN